MDQPAEEILAAELRPGERLLWAGHPRRGLIFRAADAFIIPFSLLWAGFAIFWEAMVFVSGAPALFVAWGIPFVLLGLYFVFGRFAVDARMRARTYYGVTSERVVIISGLTRRAVKSLNLRTLSDVSLTEKANGFGTITFGPTLPMFRWFGTPWPGGGWYAAPAFDLIPDARGVYDRICEAQRTR